MSTNAPLPPLGSLRLILELAALVVILLLALLAGRSWLAARAAAAQLAATISSQKKLLDDAAAREQQRDVALSKSVAAIARAKSAVKTPAEATAQIPSALADALSPSLPAPVAVELPPRTPDEPTPPATATIPQVDLVPLYGAIQDCRACRDKLAAAQSDLADERKKEAALTTERDAAVKAARGGCFWSRAKSAAKWLALGAAIGAAAVAAAHR